MSTAHWASSLSFSEWMYISNKKKLFEILYQNNTFSFFLSVFHIFLSLLHSLFFLAMYFFLYLFSRIKSNWMNPIQSNERKEISFVLCAFPFALLPFPCTTNVCAFVHVLCWANSFFLCCSLFFVPLFSFLHSLLSRIQKIVTLYIIVLLCALRCCYLFLLFFLDFALRSTFSFQCSFSFNSSFLKQCIEYSKNPKRCYVFFHNTSRVKVRARAEIRCSLILNHIKNLVHWLQRL